MSSTIAAEKVALHDAIHDAVSAFMAEVEDHAALPLQIKAEAEMSLEAQADAFLASAGFDTDGERLSDVVPHKVPFRFGGNTKEAQTDHYGRLTLAEVNEIGGFIVTYGNWYGMPKPASYRKKAR